MTGADQKVSARSASTTPAAPMQVACQPKIRPSGPQSAWGAEQGAEDPAPASGAFGTPLTAAQLADRDAARREHKAGRSRSARVSMPAPLGEVLCGAVEVGGTVYALTRGATLAVPPAAVRWL